MDATRIFRREGYDLRCCAKAVESGKFVPELIVSRQVWPTRPRLIALERGNYLTEDTAIDAAYAQGVRWILSRG